MTINLPPYKPAQKGPGMKHAFEQQTRKKVQGSKKTEAIKEFGQIQMPQVRSDIQCITIIGQIEGHIIMSPQNKTTKYEHVIPQLVALEQSDEVKGLIIILNTVGGDVEAGLAIAEIIDSLNKPCVSLVLGGGHSIGVPIAVAADYSFIAETATMTIHPIRLTGLVVSVPQTYEYLEKMQDRVIRFVTSHSKITESNFRKLMFQTGELARDIGTVLVGKDAVKEGLVDEVGGLNKAIQKLYDLIRAREQGQYFRPQGSYPYRQSTEQEPPPGGGIQ